MLCWQVRGEDSGPGAYLRFYYCDFLDSKQHRAACQRLKDMWRDKQKDTKSLFEWVSGLKPRSKLDAYPMLLLMQEMLKEMLENKLELQLEMLEQANERIDLLDGDTSELQDQCGRMEEDLEGANGIISKLQSDLEEAHHKQQELQREIQSMQEELKEHADEIGQREAEKARIQNQLKKAQDSVEFESTINLVARSRVRQLEAELEHRTDNMRNWKQHAQVIPFGAKIIYIYIYIYIYMYIYIYVYMNI